METDRLRLLPLSAEHIDWLHALWTRPEVRRYLWDDEVIPIEQTRAIAAESETAIAEGRHGLWVAEMKTTEQRIGFVGYWPFFEPPVVQLIAGLDPDFWGAGLAGEMSRAMIDHGFDYFGFDAIRAATDAPNRASVRTLERLGFEHERTSLENGLETLFYIFAKPVSRTW